MPSAARSLLKDVGCACLTCEDLATTDEQVAAGGCVGLGSCSEDAGALRIDFPNE